MNFFHNVYYICVLGNEQKYEQEDGRLLALDATGEKVEMKEEVPECPLIVETAVDGGSEGTMDLEDDQLALMTCSLSSATSGFDDNSCASSVVGGDEMPSEETWNFDVHEEGCRQPAAAVEQPNSDGEDSRQPTITEEQVKQMEKIWLSRLEKLERRMMQAVEGEQRARDQMALLSEEKDRRIAALERQVDTLEADDFRLTKTIHTLEQLERVFSTHFRRSTVELHEASGSSFEAKNCNIPTTTDEVEQKTREAGIVGHPCCDETCLQCRACRTLNSTIDLLHAALAEQAAVDRRLRELAEEGTAGTQSDCTALEVVDFEAEYRELEAMVRELKQVIIVFV